MKHMVYNPKKNIPFIMITMEDNRACIDDTAKLGIHFPSQTVQL